MFGDATTSRAPLNDLAYPLDTGTVAPVNAGVANPIVSIIIPHYNDLVNLRHCLDLLAVQTAPRDSFEILVADNNSSCGLAAVSAVCGEVARAIHAPIQGAGPARNAAVRHASGRYFGFTDSDCRPDREWVARGVSAIENSDMVGGDVRVFAVDDRNPTPTEAFELVFAFNNKRYVEKLGFSISGNMFVRREVFEAVGDFRPTVAEDTDWGRRAVARGYRWRYAPDVLISHPARRDWSELKRKWRRLNSEAFALAKERRFGLMYWVARSWLVLLAPIRDVPKALLSKRLERFEHRVAALGILFRLRWWRLLESHAVLFR